MFNDFTSSSSLNYIDPFQIVIDSITMDNPTADVSFIFENSGIIKEVKTRKQTLVSASTSKQKDDQQNSYQHSYNTQIRYAHRQEVGTEIELNYRLLKQNLKTNYNV